MDTPNGYLCNNLHRLQQKEQKKTVFFVSPIFVVAGDFLKRKKNSAKNWQAANTRQMMGAVEEAFKKWDITGDGAISKYELHAALTQLGMSEAQVVGDFPLGGVG